MGNRDGGLPIKDPSTARSLAVPALQTTTFFNLVSLLHLAPPSPVLSFHKKNFLPSAFE